jgi:hypothetical protein
MLEQVEKSGSVVNVSTSVSEAFNKQRFESLDIRFPNGWFYTFERRVDQTKVTNGITVIKVLEGKPGSKRSYLCTLTEATFNQFVVSHKERDSLNPALYNTALAMFYHVNPLVEDNIPLYWRVKE